MFHLKSLLTVWRPVVTPASIILLKTEEATLGCCAVSYHSRRTWVRGRSFRADAAGTCQAWCGEEPPHCCSPFPRRATPQWDSSPMRRSATGAGQVWTDGLNVRAVCLKTAAYLWGKVVLLELPALPQIPGPDRIVESSGPQLGPVMGNIDAAGSICVALKLPKYKNTNSTD